MTGIYTYININMCMYEYTHIFIFGIKNLTYLTLWLSEHVHSMCVTKLDMSQTSLVYRAASALA